jgi:hypothetical protein
MTNVVVRRNAFNGPVIISLADTTTILNTKLEGNHYKTEQGGLRIHSPVTEIIGCFISDGIAQHQFSGQDTYIANTIFHRERAYPLSVIFASNTHLRLNNVTISGYAISASGFFATNLFLSESTLSMANTVITTFNTVDPPAIPFVALESSSVALNVRNHVDDGSLASTATGPALLNNFHPMIGSPLIDAGSDTHAVNPHTSEALQTDISQNARISGASVDIGAVETQAFFGINDAYTLQENTTFLAPAPGVLANDTFEAASTLKDDGILAGPGQLSAQFAIMPQHGTVHTEGLQGRFLYIPDPDFYGTDTFEYVAVFTDPPGSTTATVTITVLPVAQPPVAVTDAHEVVHEETLIISAPGVLGNDTHPDNLHPTPPNEGLTAELVSPPSSGVLQLFPDGSYNYTSVAPGEYSFSYKAVDPTGEKSEAGEVVIVVHPSGTELGHEGLSYGYWKNHPDAWHGTGSYDGDHGGDTISKSVEGFQSVAHHFIAAADYGLGEFTMEDALNFRGGRDLQGAARILIQQAVAALLNASHHNIRYPLTVDEVIMDVNDALASDYRRTILDLAEELDEYNNLGADD